MTFTQARLACGLSLVVAAFAFADDAVRLPLVVASATADLDGDGRADRLEIVLVSGRLYVDEGGGCQASLGDVPKVEGHFVARVRLHGRESVDTDLNELFGQTDDMWFNGTGWPIRIARLAPGRAKQFTLGQYASCASWSYYVFRVTPAGRVVSCSAELLNGDRQNSTELEPTDHGFAFREAHGWGDDSPLPCHEYRWNAKHKAFVLRSPSHACDEN